MPEVNCKKVVKFRAVLPMNTHKFNPAKPNERKGILMVGQWSSRAYHVHSTVSLVELNGEKQTTETGCNHLALYFCCYCCSTFMLRSCGSHMFSFLNLTCLLAAALRMLYLLLCIYVQLQPTIQPTVMKNNYGITCSFHEKWHENFSPRKMRRDILISIIFDC